MARHETDILIYRFFENRYTQTMKTLPVRIGFLFFFSCLFLEIF